MSNSSGNDHNTTSDQRPSKTLKIVNSSPSYILSFTNENPSPMLNFDLTLKPKGKVVNVMNCQNKEIKHVVQEREKARRSPHQVQDHILAERKRRQDMSQQFIALSALIPGLKKMDKATVLRDAIQHMKQLQEQVKVQEEQIKRKSTESVVYVEKPKSPLDEDVSDTSSNPGNENSSDPLKTDNVSLPEIEARFSENKVLIRIHCEKKEGVLMDILREIHDLHLSVINSSTLLFGTSKLDITIIAEMDDGFKLSVKELGRNLRVRLLQFM